MFRPGLFAGQTIVVTGGGTGIGRCTSHELAALGAHVVVVGRTNDQVDRVCSEIRADGGSCSIAVFDVRDEESLETGVRDILTERRRIHGLVNGPGEEFPAPLAAISKKGFQAVLNNNLTAAFLVAREVFVQSLSMHGGSIVNILSDMWGGMPAMGHSGAARAGLLNITETAAVEWASAGVRVNAVAPGYVASNLSEAAGYEDSMVRAQLPTAEEEVPLRRVANEAEVAAAIAFLLSEAAAFITGAVIKVDGGASCNRKMFRLAPHKRSKPFDGFHRAQQRE